MTQNKTFCFFSANYLPYMGGIERNTSTVARYLSERSHKVIIVTSNVFRLQDIEEAEHAKIYRMPCYNLLDGRFPVLRMNRVFRKLNKQLLEEKIDYVIVNTRFYIHTLYGVRFAKKLGLPCIVHERGTGHFTVNNRFFDSVGHVYEHAITWLVRRFPVRFYGVSLASSEWLTHFGIKPSGVIYNAIELGEVEKYREKPTQDFRSGYGVEPDDIVVTFTGRLVIEKGIMKLVEAMKILEAEGLKVHLFIAGDGPLLGGLRHCTEHNIHVLGRLQSPCVYSLLSQSDIFCFPTDYPEGFPTSVMEAVACRSFCITTPRGGTRELLHDDSYGIVLDVSTPETIAAAIRIAAEDSSYRNSASEKAYKRLAETFSWDKTVDRFFEIFG